MSTYVPNPLHIPIQGGHCYTLVAQCLNTDFKQCVEAVVGDQLIGAFNGIGNDVSMMLDNGAIQLNLASANNDRDMKVLFTRDLTGQGDPNYSAVNLSGVLSSTKPMPLELLSRLPQSRPIAVTGVNFKDDSTLLIAAWPQGLGWWWGREGVGGEKRESLQDIGFCESAGDSMEERLKEDVEWLRKSSLIREEMKKGMVGRCIMLKTGKVEVVC